MALGLDIDPARSTCCPAAALFFVERMGRRMSPRGRLDMIRVSSARAVALGVFLAAALPGSASAQVIGGPTLYVTNGLFENSSAYQPLVFTWRAHVRFSGELWAPNSAVTIHLYCPVNTLGVAPSRIR